jgi:hypothetical protein
MEPRGTGPTGSTFSAANGSTTPLELAGAVLERWQLPPLVGKWPPVGREEKLMSKKYAFGLAVLTATLARALAQSGGPSGPGSVTGDPAASSASQPSAPTTGAARQSPSGSGTSSSGGRDDNGDQGRDKMPESGRSVRPEQRNNGSGR